MSEVPLLPMRLRERIFLVSLTAFASLMNIILHSRLMPDYNEAIKTWIVINLGRKSNENLLFLLYIRMWREKEKEV